MDKLNGELFAIFIVEVCQVYMLLFILIKMKR